MQLVNASDLATYHRARYRQFKLPRFSNEAPQTSLISEFEKKQIHLPGSIYFAQFFEKEQIHLPDSIMSGSTDIFRRLFRWPLGGGRAVEDSVVADVGPQAATSSSIY